MNSTIEVKTEAALKVIGDDRIVVSRQSLATQFKSFNGREDILLREASIGRPEKTLRRSPLFRSRGGQGCCGIRAREGAATS